MPHVSRFKKRSSDRSGFDYFESQLIKDSGYKVGPGEFDEPPPSKRGLGGEGDLSGSPRASSTFVIGNTGVPSEVDNPTVYITAAGGVTASLVHPFMRVTGSNAAVTVTANPRISSGREKDVLTLLCVDSSITLANGNGVATMGSAPLVLSSGRMATFYYSTGNTAWNETSRGLP